MPFAVDLREPVYLAYGPPVDGIFPLEENTGFWFVTNLALNPGRDAAEVQLGEPVPQSVSCDDSQRNKMILCPQL